jgi:hypothetical protein
MNSESNSKMQGTQSEKPTAKRAHRANRPVLVTEKTGAGLDEPTKQAIEEAMQPEIPLAAETGSPVERKRRPGFFANIGRTEKDASEKKADPQAARMARAMRGKSVDISKEKEQAKEKKAVATSSSARSGAAPARPRSGFKMRYIMGMMAYLLIADFLGVWITNWMVANKLDGVIFTIGSFRATRSTLIFLALLIVILVVMARLDLIPRSLRAISEPSTPRNANTPAKKAPTSTFETKTSQPTVKQGVKGEHDDLYQEYRANQRYFQRRDRKR